MPEKPIVFISCGQFTPEEIDLGNEIERFIREETPYEPYFAEQQNTLEGLVSNILSALHRAAAFIAIMHHRGTLTTPSGNPITRGSVWVEQELAICAFIHHILDRQVEVILYLQRGVTREGIRSQLRLKPVDFDSNNDVLEDLRIKVPRWELLASSTAPLIAHWEWKLLPDSTGDRHNYMFSVQLYNNSNALIEQWKAELWFPSSFIENADSRPTVYRTTSDIDYTADDKRIWPGASMQVFTLPYVVTNANWPGMMENADKIPKVRIRVSTANAQSWEEEISITDIEKF